MCSAPFLVHFNRFLQVLVSNRFRWFQVLEAEEVFKPDKVKEAKARKSWRISNDDHGTLW